MADSQTLQEKVIKGSLIAISLSLLGAFSAYFIRILYSHTLSIEDYGLFYAVFALFNIFTTYTDLGFGYATVYLLPKYIKLENYSKAWNIFVYGQAISVTMAFFITTLLIIFAPLIANDYLKVPGSERLIYIFCLYLITFTILNGLIQVYSGMQKEKYYSSITASRWVLTFIFSSLFFIFHVSDVFSYSIAWVLGHIFTVFIFFYFLHYKHSFITRNKVVLEHSTFKEMYTLSFPALLETMVYSLMIFADTFVLTLFKGLKEVGAYNIIYPISSIPIILLTPINNLLLPLVSHLMEGEKTKMEYLVKKVLEVVPFIGMYFSLFIAMFPSAVVGLIFGEKWLGLVETPLVILSLGSIAIIMSGILGTITLGIGRVKDKLRAGVVIAVLSIGLNTFLIWKYGILGAVIGHSLIPLILNILFLRIISNVVSFNIPYVFYVKLMTFSTVLFVSIRFAEINPQNWIEFITAGIIYTIIFMIFGFILKIYDKDLILMLLPRNNFLYTKLSE